VVTLVLLSGLCAWVLVQLGHWARRAREDEER
jgi:hypothetical protein